MISDIRIPSRFPLATLAAIVLWLAACFGIFTIWHRSLPPLESFYLPTYAKSVLPEVHLSRRTPDTRFLVVYVGYVMATEPTLASARPGQLVVRPVSMQKRWFDAWLRLAIYHGDTFPQLLKVPGIIAALLLLPLLLWGGIVDARRMRKRRDGVRLRGPELLTVKQFNRRVKGDGLEFLLKGR